MRRTRICVEVCVYVVFGVIAVAAIFEDKHSGSKCPGPVSYYEALECTPVYNQGSNSCANEYLCDHIETRSSDKCYINGHEYNLYHYLNNEDAYLVCDAMCTCEPGHNRDEIAAFECFDEDCPTVIAKDDCYLWNDPFKCCGDPQNICSEEWETRYKCNVNGKIYLEGEYFYVDQESDLTCVCQSGYKGNNIPPFCVRTNHTACAHPAFSHINHLKKKCAPIYFYDEFSKKKCYMNMICQNADDVVIPKSEFGSSDTLERGSKCQFGNLTMQVGDKLKRSTQYSTICIACICEVPPVLTCELQSQDICKRPW
ncbi:uncharacterized protein LOC105193732 [Solenopsis invicta]|uniref:uncharacterized protein LOC105193732 n=1 Tax=Solenopsis invicta TaxID=13686 RepID=UPI0005963332|nr:uncharacterized protein LOC105193732 [Solenopsis invicta]